MDTAVDALFDLTPAVRYVAFYQDGDLYMHKRPGIGKATTRESTITKNCWSTLRSLRLQASGEHRLRGPGIRGGPLRNFYQFIVPAGGV